MTPPAPVQARWFRRHPKKAIALGVSGFILGLDLLLGFVFIPADLNAYRCPHPVYHHGLLPNREDATRWGKLPYRMVTNSLGFRDASPRSVPLARPAGRKRLLIMGDSFGEGLGYDYGTTFAGRLTETLAARGLDVLNSSAVSYSPKLHHLKLEHLLDEGLEVDRVLLFIDISDIQNEIAYEPFRPAPFDQLGRAFYEAKRFGRRRSFLWFHLGSRAFREERAFARQFGDPDLFPCLVGIAKELQDDPWFREAQFTWTLNPSLFEKYGRRGLELAKTSVAKIVDLCRKRKIDLALVIYPWPDQIQHRDLGGLQEREWQAFAQEHRVRLLNLFPDFIGPRSAYETIASYFIPGDVHWNAAGHELVARRVADFLR